ncbi:hypothetical protein [Streptomyces sp. NPDC005799]|uniref:hypothetical protein n=1 Tax=Streptomyces sp. NPDC005799 TaxID=3154678 RepID=UPI0033F11A03
MGKAKPPTGPRGHGYCWVEHPGKGVHCTEPIGHPPGKSDGGHWHPYSKTAW